MASLFALVVELIVSAFDLVVIIVRDVALRDPLSFVSFLVGAALTTGSIAVFGYLAVGALVDWLGDLIESPRQPPQQAR